MPIYEYECRQCREKFSLFRNAGEHRKKGKCPNCGRLSGRIISLPNLVTDNNFGYTGKVDRRLGKQPIEGRADWKRRVEQKGLMEIDLNNEDKIEANKEIALDF